MRSPRLIFAVVAGLLVLTGALLPRYLADRSRPDLGNTVVVPASNATPTTTPPTPSTPAPTGTTTPPPTRTTKSPGAAPVSPGTARSAGQDDDDDLTDDQDDDG